METFNLSVFISQVRSSGLDPERPKIDIKREWYRLGSADPLEKVKAENEFVKDLAATANTPGLAGYLILGLAEDGTVKSCPFSDSGLRDQSDLQNIVVKRVSEPVYYELEEKIFCDNGVDKVISIIRIPPSLQKPHVIRLYRTPKGFEVQNYIPIRKGTSINPAGKYDIDFMFYDRKNIEPDYGRGLTVSYFTSNLDIARRMHGECDGIILWRFDVESWLTIGYLANNAYPKLVETMLRVVQNFRYGNSAADQINTLYLEPEARDFNVVGKDQGLPLWMSLNLAQTKLYDFIGQKIIPETDSLIKQFKGE